MTQHIGVRGLGFRPDLRLSAHQEIKVKTRRTVGKVPHGAEFMGFDPKTGIYSFEIVVQGVTLEYRKRCPYGVVGDYLYVKEPWRVVHRDHDYWYEYREQVEGLPTRVLCTDTRRVDWAKSMNYRAQIFFPREAARSLFRITSINVEHVQHITDEEAEREGVARKGGDWVNYLNELRNVAELEDCGTPRSSFITLWQRINGLESWERDPLVWVLGFEKTEKLRT